MNLNRLNKCRSALLAQAFIAIAFMPGAVFAASSSSKSNDAAPAEMEAQRQANVKVVMAYYAAALKDDFEEARKYIGTRYIEHDSTRKDGVAGLQNSFEQEKKKRKQKTASHQIVIADNDLVALMSQVAYASLPMGGPPPPAANSAPGAAPPPPPATSTEGVPVGGPLTGSLAPPQTTVETRAELFRLEDGKIVEHWLTIQGLGNP